MGFGVGWRGGGVWVAVVGVSVSWSSGQGGGVFGLQSCSGSGISAGRGPGCQESLRPLRHRHLFPVPTYMYAYIYTYILVHVL